MFELTGNPGKINAFVGLMEAIGTIEVCRGGVVAIARGSNISMVTADGDAVDDAAQTG